MPIVRMVMVLGMSLFILFIPTFVEADDSWRQKSENWLQIADLIVMYVEKGKYLEARNQVIELSQEFSKANLSKKKLNIGAVHMLSSELVRMESRLNQVVVSNPKELQRGAMRLKLAFDAVSHPNQPLWKQYYQPIKQRIALFHQAERRQDHKGMTQAIQSIRQEYDLIRSAVVVSKKPETVQKLDSLVKFMEEQKEPNLQSVGVKRLEQVIDPLFFGSDQDVLSAYQPYVNAGVEIIILWICFWITAIFAYAGYKNYRSKRQAA